MHGLCLHSASEGRRGCGLRAGHVDRRDVPGLVVDDGRPRCRGSDQRQAGARWVASQIERPGREVDGRQRGLWADGGIEHLQINIEGLDSANIGFGL